MAKANFCYQLHEGDDPAAPLICHDIDAVIECTVSRSGEIESVDSVVVDGAELLKSNDPLARLIGERIRAAAESCPDFLERILEDEGLAYVSTAPWNGSWAEVA